MIEALPQQVVLYEEPNGYRESMHRSIGDCDELLDAGGRDHVFVRNPTPEDNAFVTCCTSHRCMARTKKLTANIRTRPIVLAVFESSHEAWEWAERHATAHMLAKGTFGERQVVAYRRQARLERALA